jgi:hypothetical protein
MDLSKLNKEKVIYSINCGDEEYTDKTGFTYSAV